MPTRLDLRIKPDVKVFVFHRSDDFHPFLHVSPKMTDSIVVFRVVSHADVSDKNISDKRHHDLIWCTAEKKVKTKKQKNKNKSPTL